MNDKLRQIITIERTLSQLRQTLKFNFKMTLEEFILLYHVYENEKLSGKALRDTLHFELMWDMSKIDVLIRKVYKKELVAKMRSETDERQVYYYFEPAQKSFFVEVVEKIEQNDDHILAEIV
ncbi:MarR family transcriptional regulator [Staphylococcus auricularis]|uniref:MarR family transcriptional regulator n=1 Tax=Staphylococcus auricularis TaxID=29379 RepID=A0AAP8PPD7_9STAP|nr:MarR family transcriptional regulator [Staphylococcus auricularis]MBM0867307.1 MarR family transcriptional regulator [Staphylococcus auricularis]MDC6327580.1 MarR family transcriptional regulator [Staphylococcus auricularis]MDN4533532.1 MarR family transcriptional regulator [Staphylococcus auricularis]PNZ68004.1 MarR family transcriptional regulator [Staphylococcus auricularis]QPT06608.1 MarR family transcriptional regulator [Staphylococcus auricularis]